MKIIILTLLGFILFAGCQNNSTTPSGHDHAAANQKMNAAAKYHCPMHPQVVSDKPGSCPICGMTLVPIESSTTQTNSNEQSVQGQASVHLAEGKEQLIGVRTAKAEMRDLERLIRASAKVAFDPDLYNAITEYKEAVLAAEKTKDSTWADVKERSHSLIQSSLMRLRLMGITPSEANKLANSKNLKNLLLAESGEKVWVYAQIYEYESPYVKTGQTMEVSSPALPGQQFGGLIKSVDSVLNPETRSLKVRAEITNPNGLLKPEMYVEAVIHARLGKKLAIPKEAVMDTGTRQMIFVQTAPGHFDPRDVRVGVEAEKYVEIVSGLKEGEEVSISGNFLIDSESKLKATQQGAGHQH